LAKRQLRVGIVGVSTWCVLTRDQPPGVNAVDFAFSPASGRLVVRYDDQTARVWDLAAGRPELAVGLEGGTYAFEGVAAGSDSNEDPEEVLGPALIARFVAQEAVVAVPALATEILGGGAFVSLPEIAYLYAACRCLAFHPPSREVGTAAMTAHLRGTWADVN